MIKKSKAPEWALYRYVNRHGLIKTRSGGGEYDIVEFLGRDDAFAEVFLAHYVPEGKTLDDYRPLEAYREGTPKFDACMRPRRSGE